MEANMEAAVPAAVRAVAKVANSSLKTPSALGSTTRGRRDSLPVSYSWKGCFRSATARNRTIHHRCSTYIRKSGRGHRACENSTPNFESRLRSCPDYIFPGQARLVQACFHRCKDRPFVLGSPCSAKV
eukprot:scaffold16531_cov55-Phaeocystis_antarctica.AAC.3